MNVDLYFIVKIVFACITIATGGYCLAACKTTKDSDGDTNDDDKGGESK